MSSIKGKLDKVEFKRSVKKRDGTGELDVYEVTIGDRTFDTFDEEYTRHEGEFGDWDFTAKQNGKYTNFTLVDYDRQPGANQQGGPSDDGGKVRGPAEKTTPGQLDRIESKLDMLLKHYNLEPTPSAGSTEEASSEDEIDINDIKFE